MDDQRDEDFDDGAPEPETFITSALLVRVATALYLRSIRKKSSYLRDLHVRCLHLATTEPG